jgi:hypothetical protein
VRAAGRPVRVRAAAQVVACLVAVCAIVYIAVMRDGLLDLVVHTVRFGPDR